MLRKHRPTDLAPFVAYLDRSRGLAKGTQSIYVRWVGRYLTDEPRDLQAWLIEQATSAATFTQACSALKAWGKYQRDKSLLGELEDVDRPKKPKGLPKPIENPEAVLATMSPLCRLASTFLRETGLRISEAYSINVGELVPHQLVIRGKGSKDRIVLLSPIAREALLALGGKMPWSKRWLQREMQKAGTHPHAWRHTFGTELAASDADLGEIQELMGHSSPATTRGYAAYSTKRLRAAQERRSAFVAGG